MQSRFLEKGVRKEALEPSLGFWENYRGSEDVGLLQDDRELIRPRSKLGVPGERTVGA